MDVVIAKKVLDYGLTTAVEKERGDEEEEIC
jgi:hypothetical protein